jgi:alpha-L-rhamnosidase
VAGIGQAEDSAGFTTIRIEPQFHDSLTFVEATYDSIRGPISTRWERDGDNIRLIVTIPANGDAEIVLPSGVQTAGSGTHEFSIPA